MSDLPAFYGNEKDTLSAESIVLRTEAAALALGWNDEATFNNFGLEVVNGLGSDVLNEPFPLLARFSFQRTSEILII